MDRNRAIWKRTGTAVIVFVTCILLGVLRADEIALLKSSARGGGTSVLHFPRDRCMGNLYVEPESVSGWDPERVGPQYNWEYAGTARGDAAVPHDRNVQLVVRLGPRPGDSARLLAQNRLAHQMLVADGARVEPDDLSGLSGLGPDDLCWLAVSALVPRADADQRVLEPVRRLTGLQMLSLHTTGVTDKGMEYLRDLRSLKALELSGELSLGNTGMAVLKDLPALEYLDLDTGVTDAGLKQIGQLPNARWLRIRTGGFWGPGLAELAKLPRLERLCLVGEVGLSDRHLQYLESLLHLKSLTLWGGACDRLTDPSLASIGKLKDLEELNFIMTSPRFTPAGIAHLKDLKNLKKIDFAQAWSGPEAARYGDDVVRQLAALPGLESIKGVSYLSAEGMKVLAAFRNLRRLGIGLKDRHQGYHGPTGLSHLGGLSALEELSFTGGEALSEADLAGLESLSRLKVLSIMSSHLTDQSLASISKLERLEQLNLAGTRASRNGLNQLSGLKSLRGLDVQMWAEVRPTNVTDELALDLSKLQGLKRLRLSGLALQEADAAFLANLRHLEGVTIDASSLPGTSLRYLRGLSELEYLSVRGLSRPTGGDLAPLAGLANVKTLILGGEIADTALTSLDGLSGLQWLNVETAAPIRSQTIADLKQRLPMIEYIHISEPLPQPAVSSERPRVSPPRGNQPAPQSRRRGR